MVWLDIKMGEIEENSIIDAYNAVLRRIRLVQQKQNSVQHDVHLVTVSKTFSRSIIEPVLRSGHRIFGENKVQEAQSKWVELKQKYEGCELHLIGPLQTNKTRDAVALFDVIQTLDRPKLAKFLAKEMEKQKKTVNLFIQVNIGDEPQKAGIAVNELSRFVKLCRDDLKLPVIGLMCIPPKDDDPRPHFNKLKQLADVHKLKNISMGMSADFETAIECGANYVRVGSAIFGNR